MGKVLSILKRFIFFQQEKKNEDADKAISKEIEKKYVLFDGIEFVNSDIGDYSYIARNSIVHNCNIGKFTSIGPCVVIGYGDHPVNFVSTSIAFYQQNTAFDLKPVIDKFNGHKKVVVGNDVWIGANCYIKNGLTIGDGAIVGAGAVVTKDIPPYAIVVGVPARIIRYRFSEKNISRLLATKWWNWEYSKIKTMFEYFGSDDIDAFFDNL